MNCSKDSIMHAIVLGKHMQGRTLHMEAQMEEDQIVLEQPQLPCK